MQDQMDHRFFQEIYKSQFKKNPNLKFETLATFVSLVIMITHLMSIIW
jgi:hypothetical protein